MEKPASDAQQALVSKTHWRDWVKRIAAFSGLEIVSRVLQMAASLLIVRLMVKEEFAWYSLAVAFQGMLGFVTMIGAGSALFAMGGPLIEDRRGMGQLLHAVGRWRFWLMAFSLPVLLPIYGFLLMRNGCPPLTLALLLVFGGLTMWLEIQRHMLSAPLELAQRYNFLQKVDCISAVVRLAGVGVLIACAWIKPVPVMLISVVLVGWLPLVLMRKASHAIADPDVREAPEAMKKRLRALAIAATPSALSYVAEAQYATLFVALAGFTAGVAELGALGRIGLLLTVPAAILGRVIQPRLALIREDTDLRRAWLRTAGFGLLIGTGMIVGTWLFQDLLLWLLGSEYQYVRADLMFYAGFLGLSFLTNANGSIIEARGWLKRAWVRPFVVIGAMLLATPIVSVATVPGAIVLMYVGCLANLATDLFLIIRGFRGLSDVHG